MNYIDALLAWIDDRSGLRKAFLDQATHPVPRKATWAYVFGTAIVTAFAIQLLSGISLSTLYVPSAGEAFESLKYITHTAPFGSIIRGVHYYGASAMILFVGIHAIQTYLYGSFKYPRELNWLSGVILLFLTVAIGFTGQVLRWDQTAVWTVAVGAEQALRVPFVGKWAVEFFTSGGTVGSSTLSHFFAMHVFILPGLLIAIVGFHVFLVLHNGISEPPVVGEPVDPKTYRKNYHELLERDGVPFWPDAAWRDAVFSVLVALGILACAVIFGPPAIEKPPDPSIINAQPRPDWYLLWYFALLALVPSWAEDAVILIVPAIMVLGLLVVPFISNTGERHIKRRPWAVAAIAFIVTCIGSLWRAGTTEPWTPVFEAKPVTADIIGATSGPIYDGAQVFNDRGCLYCHMISGHGGGRGPDLTDVGQRLTQDQIIIRIVNGGINMPAYAGNIKPEELKAVTAFLMSRKTNTGTAPFSRQKNPAQP